LTIFIQYIILSITERQLNDRFRDCWRTNTYKHCFEYFILERYLVMVFIKRFRYVTLMLCSLALLSACGKSSHYGYRSYDPCISCGDTITFYPNEEGGAQRYPRDWVDWEWGDGNPNLCQEYPNLDRCQKMDP
jgi:hypothetical protein